MSKTLKTVLISVGLLAALIFGLSKCGGSGISSGLSVLDKLVKARPDTIIRIDTVFKLIPVYRDTCLGGIKVQDLDKKTQKKINRILKKNINEIPKLYPVDLYQPEEGLTITIDSDTMIWLIMANGDSLLVPKRIFTSRVQPSPYYINIPTDSTSTDTTLDSPKRLYYSLPIDCYTKTESAKLQKNSTRTLNAIGGIDARGYVYGGLLLRSSGGFGMGFYVSSGRYNGLQIQVPIKRFR